MIEELLKKRKETQIWNDMKSLYSIEGELIEDVMILNGEVLLIMKSGSAFTFNPQDGALKLIGKESVDKITQGLTKDLEDEAIARDKAVKRLKKSQAKEQSPEKKEEVKEDDNGTTNEKPSEKT